jgi:hypothetical protein
MSTPTASDQLDARIAAVSNSRLTTTLQILDAAMSAADPAAVSAEQRLVRARLIGEVERRWPAASAAVQAAFEAWDAAAAALEDGQELPADVDYVAVLLAAIPNG